MTSPLILASEDALGTNYTEWIGTGDAIVGVTYETGVDVSQTSTWTGNYALNITVTAPGILIAQVTGSYNYPGMVGTFTSISWQQGSGYVSFVLPTHTSTGSGYTFDYYFHLAFGTTYAGVVVSFTAYNA